MQNQKNKHKGKNKKLSKIKQGKIHSDTHPTQTHNTNVNLCFDPNFCDCVIRSQTKQK